MCAIERKEKDLDLEFWVIDHLKNMKGWIIAQSYFLKIVFKFVKILLGYFLFKRLEKRFCI